MLLLMLTACEYKELCYDHNHTVEVRIVFDWSQQEVRPRGGMTVWFYHAEHPEAEPLRFDLPGTAGGTVRLPIGRYRVLAYNNDTETIRYQGTELIDSLTACTRWSSIEEGTLLSSHAPMPQADSTDLQRIMLEPDPLWAASYGDLPVRLSDMECGLTVTMQPGLRYYDVTVTILHVQDMSSAYDFGGSLSGVSSQVTMLTGKVSDDAVIQPFPVRTASDSTLTASLRIFGHCPAAVHRHLLTVYALLDGGSGWYHPTDVTAQMHDAAHFVPPNHIYITIDSLALPKPLTGGSGGFHPTVDDWEQVNIDLGGPE